MREFWRSKNRFLASLVIVLSIYLLNSSFCWSLNDEGVALLRFKEKIVSDPHGALSNWNYAVGVESPCSWFGVGCSEGYVVALNLKDLCLRGTLASDLGDLVHVKSIILRNNSFSGMIPEEIANLKELKLLDFGHNNFSGLLPGQLGTNFSVTIVLLDNNELLGDENPDIYEPQKLSDAQVEKKLLSSGKQGPSCNELVNSWNSGENHNVAQRKLLQENPFWPEFFFPPPPPSESNVANAPSPVPSLSPSPAPAPASAPASAPAPTPAPAPGLTEPSPSLPSPPLTPSPFPSVPAPSPGPSAPTQHSGSNHHRILLLTTATVGPVLLLLLIVGVFLFKSGKIATVKPWATGLSGQLQRAFLTAGVPKLKRSELEAACEDFSNVIGSSSVRTLYKGTLSSGVEIAVASVAVTSKKYWSNNLESQFRNKIDTLSKVNHKNFVSLLGYCEEEEPFTRMLVFEYAPNGTLFEHLHIREAEHLDWLMRIRIAMGMAYCLEHMHQLNPPLAHRNLNSSNVYLTEDYAAKLSDFALPDEVTSSYSDQPNLQSNVYDFGVVLFEIITGKLPYATGGSNSLQDWASDYLSGARAIREMVDPTLKAYSEDQLERIGGVIRLCADPDPRQRPPMNEVCQMLREITGIGPDGAIPRVSPLWWAELEILSTEAN